MTEDLEVLKSNPAILRLYGQYVSLRKEGNKYVGLCKFHAEKSGSFTVFAKDQGWKCFGCGKTGDIFSFIQELDKITFKEAVEKVKLFVGGGTKWEQDKAQVEAVFKPVMPDKTYITFSMDQYSIFENNLVKSKEGIEWLAGRGISLETAQRLHVGFTQDVKGKSGPDNKDINDKGWIVFPCIEDGKVVSIKYRSIIRKVFCKQPQMRTSLFNTPTIDIFEPVYLVEGECDALALEEAGFKAVSLASASSYPTPEQKDQLMQATSVFLSGDMDGAVGEEVMGKLWNDLEERTFMLKWPGIAKDANEFLLSCKDVDDFRSKIDDLTQLARTQPMPDVYSLQDIMLNSSEMKLSDHPNRLHMPWPEVDKMANLLPGSVLALYATQTGMGKTAFATQVCLHNAMKHGDIVVMYQCELSPEEIGIMVTAQLLRKNRNFITKEDQISAAKMLNGVQFYIWSNPSVEGSDEILDLLDKAVRRYGASLACIDHFHHLTRSSTNENAIQGAASKRIKTWAQKRQLKVINIGQPRKAQSNSKGKRTHVTDAKGNAAYADDADSVFAIHRELSQSDPNNPAPDTYDAKTLVHAQKTRSKGIGSAECYVTFFGAFAAFEQITESYGEPA